MTTEDSVMDQRAEFEGALMALVQGQSARSYLMTRQRLEATIEETIAAVNKVCKKTPKDFRRLSMFDVQIDETGHRTLINRKHRDKTGDVLIYVPVEEFFDILHECHIRLEHKRTMST
jgi:hypothetical protein